MIRMWRIFMRHLPSLPLFILGIVVLSYMPASGLAQTSCPSLVEQAITALGDNCSALDRNSACYGYDNVEATFTEEVTPDYFVHPADRATLTTVDTLRTAPL